MTLKHLDLFSGIGGFALAARMVGGYETVGFCEIDPYCQAVLRKHWPGVPIYDDVRSLSGRATGPVDIVTGGFPCQDISHAGKRAGIDGGRSGLWSEIRRLVRELRPENVLVENVSALLDRGMGRVLGDLAEIGYDAEWHCIPASAVGAPHDRDRVWLVAYPDSVGRDISQQLARRLRTQRQPCFWESFRTTDFALRVQELAAFCRAADGLSAGLDGRLHAVGNAIVPQVAAIFLEAIRTCHEAQELGQ